MEISGQVVRHVTLALIALTYSRRHIQLLHKFLPQEGERNSCLLQAARFWCEFGAFYLMEKYEPKYLIKCSPSLPLTLFQKLEGPILIWSLIFFFFLLGTRREKVLLTFWCGQFAFKRA